MVSLVSLYVGQRYSKCVVASGGLDMMSHDHAAACCLAVGHFTTPEMFQPNIQIQSYFTDERYISIIGRSEECVCLCVCVCAPGWGLSAGRRCPCGRPGVGMTGATGRTSSQLAEQLWCLSSHRCPSDCGSPPRCNLTQFRVSYRLCVDTWESITVSTSVLLLWLLAG